MSVTEQYWQYLLDSIRENKCTPFIGQGAAGRWLPFGIEIAQNWAKTYDYPLDFDYSLAKVSEFIAISSGIEMFPKNLLSRMLKKVAPPNFALGENMNTLYSILADLDFPIYLTTTYDNFMEAALASKGKKPVSEVCRWNNSMKVAGIPSIFEKNQEYQPTTNEPLVYHLFGHIDIPSSLVLTEIDYADFVIKLSRDESDILPSIVRAALYKTLLFLGFNIYDTATCILLRAFIPLSNKGLSPNIAVLFPPSTQKTPEAARYLETYAKNVFNSYVYWGDIESFSLELRKRYESYMIVSSEAKQINADASPLKKYYERSHAIIIGISEYKEEMTLPYAYNDAQAIKKILQEKYSFDNVVYLFNKEATADKMREIFIDMLQDPSIIGPRDRVLIYYSGHAKLRMVFGFGGEEIKEGFIIPYDSNLKKFSSRISMGTIVNSCQISPAKHVLLILDCCFSGYAAMRSGKGSYSEISNTLDRTSDRKKPTKVTNSYIQDIADRRAIQVIAAGLEDQPVSNSGDRPGYSAFTGALLDILEPGIDLDNNGILTASEIAYHLEKFVAIQHVGVFQRPAYSHISGSTGGDFIFKIFNIKS